MKKTIAMMLSFAVAMSAFVCGGAVSASNGLLSAEISRSSAFTVFSNKLTTGETLQASGDRRSYITFDFTGYEAKLYTASEITISANASYSNESLIKDIRLVVIDDSKESTITNYMTNAGTNSAQANSDGVWAGGTEVANAVYSEGQNSVTISLDADKVKAALRSGSNSILILRAQHHHNSNYNNQINSNSVKISIKYPELYVDTPTINKDEGKVTFVSYNNASAGKNYVAIVAVYEGAELKNIEVKEIMSAADAVTNESININGITSGRYVKAFALTNKDDAVPLCVNAK